MLSLRHKSVTPLKWIALGILVIFLAALCYYTGDIPFLSTQRRDSELIQKMMENSTETEGSYAATAIAYRAIKAVMDIRLFLAIVGSLAIYITLKRADRLGDLAITSVCALFAVLMQLSVSSKDVFVSMMAVATLGVVSMRSTPLLARIAVILAIYILYGALVRSYYNLIAALAVIFMFSWLVPSRLRLISVIGAIGALSLVASEQIIDAQATRDFVNNFRSAYLGGEGSRTAFYNLTSPDSLVDFYKNYVYAAARLTFPIFWHLSLKDAIFLLFSQAMLIAGIVLVCRRDAESRVLGVLIFGQMAVCWIFEPDLGSYARHLSSIFPYTAALWMFRTGSPVTARKGGVAPGRASPLPRSPGVRHQYRSR